MAYKLLKKLSLNHCLNKRKKPRKKAINFKSRIDRSIFRVEQHFFHVSCYIFNSFEDIVKLLFLNWNFSFSEIKIIYRIKILPVLFHQNLEFLVKHKIIIFI